MTSKKFVKNLLSFILLVITLIVVVNIYVNEFGLFGNVRNSEYRVHAYEKTTKYLYSFNYIPSNFDGILVGPSFSDQMMDTKKIENHKIYNLSMNGGNITELKYPIDNVLKFGDIKTFIICLDPYITKNSGTKSSQINPKEYYSTLGSLFLLKYYIEKFLDDRRGENSVYRDSYWGYENTSHLKKNADSTNLINSAVSEMKNADGNLSIPIDAVAYQQLDDVLKSVRKNNVKIVAYYFPRPKRFFELKAYNIQYNNYKTKIDELLNYNDDIVIDFNNNAYDFIRGLDSSYSDAGHLSREGADKILKILNQKLNNAQ